MVAAIETGSLPVRKRRGPKPTGKTPQVSVRLGDEITTALDKLVDGDAIQTRSEAIRHIVTEWLRANQMLERNPKSKPRR